MAPPVKGTTEKMVDFSMVAATDAIRQTDRHDNIKCEASLPALVRETDKKLSNLSGWMSLSDEILSRISLLFYHSECP